MSKYFVPRPTVIIYYGDREVCNDTTLGKREYRRRTLEMLERQHYLCPICTLDLWEPEATFDHEVPRGLGGGMRDDRIWIPDDAGGLKPHNFATHALCNSAKGSKRNTIQHQEYERTA